MSDEKGWTVDDWKGLIQTASQAIIAVLVAVTTLVTLLNHSALQDHGQKIDRVENVQQENKKTLDTVKTTVEEKAEPKPSP